MSRCGAEGGGKGGGVAGGEGSFVGCLRLSVRLMAGGVVSMGGTVGALWWPPNPSGASVLLGAHAGCRVRCRPGAPTTLRI